jgi:hypothetical protein
VCRIPFLLCITPHTFNSFSLFVVDRRLFYVVWCLVPYDDVILFFNCFMTLKVFPALPNPRSFTTFFRPWNASSIVWMTSHTNITKRSTCQGYQQIISFLLLCVNLFSCKLKSCSHIQREFRESKNISSKQKFTFCLIHVLSHSLAITRERS